MTQNQNQNEKNEPIVKTREMAWRAGIQGWHARDPDFDSWYFMTSSMAPGTVEGSPNKTAHSMAHGRGERVDVH